MRIENQPPQSVRVLKIIDTTVAKAGPTVTARVPSTANAGETIHLSADADPIGVPAVSYHWDFDDGVTADGSTLTHAYTAGGNYTVQFTAEGLDGKSAEKTFSIEVSGTINLPPPRRYLDPRE